MTNKEKHAGLVSTERAKQIISKHRIAENQDWDIDRPTKEDCTGQNFHFYASLETEDGITEKGMLVSAIFSFGKRTSHQKLHFKLEFNGKVDENYRRIIDLDSRRPVNWKGKGNDKNWPHIHIGADDRRSLPVEKNSSIIDVSKHAKMFEEYANISFKTKVRDPNELILR